MSGTSHHESAISFNHASGNAFSKTIRAVRKIFTNIGLLPYYPSVTLPELGVYNPASERADGIFVDELLKRAMTELGDIPMVVLWQVLAFAVEGEVQAHLVNCPLQG